MKFDVIRRLLALLRGQWGLMAVSSISRVVNQTLGVVIPAIAVSLVVDTAEGESAGLWRALALLGGLALVKGVFRYLEQLTGHGVAFRLLARLRVQVFRWLQQVEPGRLSGERSGDLVARVSGDIDRVEPFYAHTIAPMAAAFIVPILTLIGLGLLVSAPIAVALAPIVIAYIAVVPWIGSRRVSVVGAEARRLAGESAAVVADVVQGAGEVAVLGAGEQVLADLARLDQRSNEARSSLARDSARRSLVGGVLAGAALVTVVVVAVLLDLPSRDLAISAAVGWTIMTPLRALEEVVPDTEQALAAAERLFDLEDIQPQIQGGSTAVIGPIRFESVTVVAGSQDILDSVDLAVEEGALVGVVGPSGSGKSTLVSTLVRHRDPTGGRVTVAGIPVTELSDHELSKLVAVVPQRPDVFYGTLASNLAIANPQAGEAEMRATLARARLLDWVDRLDRGLDTPIGERGIGMSGGQLQRLAIARSLLRDPRILVLDEATSELDATTEGAVLGEIYSERGRRTLIVVAHRMETVVSADLIAVIDRGRLVELGTHESMRRSGGLYSALWERHEDMLVAENETL
ncbi:MAG TPA: ABC transporter ATP-binding protein [Acidimicrobiia bacterium]